MGPGLHDGDDRGLPARGERARPHAGDPQARGLGRLARRAARCGGSAVPALSGADGVRADGGELGSAVTETCDHVSDATSKRKILSRSIRPVHPKTLRTEISRPDTEVLDSRTDLR